MPFHFINHNHIRPVGIAPDEWRLMMLDFDWTSELAKAQQLVNAARSGALEDRLLSVEQAIEKLAKIAEAISDELAN
jgi:DNA-binding protein H-NS